jgi:hypothetical protein
MTGSARESVNRQLTAWQAEGLVELREGWIVVTEREALAVRSRPSGEAPSAPSAKASERNRRR